MASVGLPKVRIVEQPPLVQFSLDRNIRCPSHHLARRACSTRSRVPEQLLPSTIRLGQSRHDCRVSGRPSRTCDGGGLSCFKKTHGQTTRTPGPYFREDRHIRQEEVQIDRFVLDSSTRRELSTIDATIECSNVEHERRHFLHVRVGSGPDSYHSRIPPSPGQHQRHNSPPR